MNTFVPLVLPAFFGTPYYIYLMRQFVKGLPDSVIAAAAKKRVRIAKPATFYAKQKLLRMELLHCDGVHRKQHALSERAGQQVERTKTSLSWLAGDDLA